LKTSVVFVAIVLGLASQFSHGAGCVVEDDEIEVVGALSRETFAGPPNYESVDKGDKAETYWIVTVREPIALCPLASEEGKPSTIGSVNRFQLVINEEQRGIMLALMARHAWVRGKIFVAHTGHHHTAALIQVSAVGPATQKPLGLR
jgi:hypothetical protein